MGPVSGYNAELKQLHWQGDYPRAIDGVHHGALAVGMGRSYGDVCLLKDGTLVQTTSMNRLLDFDPVQACLRPKRGFRWRRFWILRCRADFFFR